MLRQNIRQKLRIVVDDEADLERPNNQEFGDFSTNIALKKKKDPNKIAEALKDDDLFEKIEIAGPGFINFTLSKKALYQELEEILKQSQEYGKSETGKEERIQVEFISANPTGPLTVANFRGGPFGDTLVNVLNKAGYIAKKAYYINDYGEQILALGHSVLKDKEAVYKGDYIDKINKEIETTEPKEAGEKASKIIIEDYLKPATKSLGINFDEWIYESEIHKSGKVDDLIKELEKKGLVYEKDNAKWFKSTKFNDRRDRVLVKSDGKKTYLAGDIALHKLKFENFDKAINIWGADHHGDVPGLLAGVEAIGHKSKLEILLYQLVAILKRGKKERMSKRKGIYVALDELLKEVSKDAIRFFFLQHSVDTHMNFDIELAKEQSNKNPVYYVQYAYARISNILKKNKLQTVNYKLQNLNQKEELDLIRQLIRFPEIIEDSAQDYQLQRLPNYAIELASSFHKFYENCRVLADDKDLSQARLALVRATQIILKNTLDLMGIESPNKM